MARQNLAVQQLSSSGIIPSWSTPTVDGFKFYNDGKTPVHIKNANVASLTVTVPVPRTIDGNTVNSKTITIASGAEREMVFPTDYNQPDTSADRGMTYLDFSVQSSVSVKATHP